MLTKSLFKSILQLINEEINSHEVFELPRTVTKYLLMIWNAVCRSFEFNTVFYVTCRVEKQVSALERKHDFQRASTTDSEMKHVFILAANNKRKDMEMILQN